MSGRGDVTINDVVYHRAGSDEGAITRQDAQPVTARAALGEGQYDFFTNDSFVAQASLAGGMGQERLIANDMFLTGVADTLRPSLVFPARKHRGTLGAVSAANQQFFDANGVVDMVESRHSATVTGSGATLAIRNGQVFREDNSDGTLMNVTPAGGVAFELVKPLGRYMFAFGRMPANSPVHVTARQTIINSGSWGTSTTFERSFTKTPLEGSLLVVTFIAGNGAAGTFAMPTFDQVADWTLVSGSDSTADGYASATYTRIAGANEPLTVSFSHGTACRWTVQLLEVEHFNTATPVASAKSVRATATSSIEGTGVNVASGIAATNVENYMVVGLTRWLSTSTGVLYASSVQLEHPGFQSAANLLTQNASGAGQRIAQQLYTAETASFGNWRLFAQRKVNSGDSDNRAAMTGVVIFGNDPPGTVTTQTLEVYYSSDDGVTWTQVESELGGAIGALVDGLPAMGALWVTTERALYRFTYEDYQFENGTTKVNVGMVGPLDTWPVPEAEGVGGKFLTISDQVLFYSCGSSIRRFVPGGQAAQVFPTEEWTGPVTTIRSLEQAEGLVFFSCNAHLMCYSGRGFHALAPEPSAGAFNKLYFHRGRLYFNDPDTYFRFDYPSSRPNSYTTDPLDFQTGYIVSSAIDLNKISLEKLISRFETHVRFTAENNTGKLVLEYANGDSCHCDPGSQFGAAPGTTWIKIGEHVRADSGIKVYSRSNWELSGVNEIKAKKIFLRLSIIPGTEGYPMVTAPWIVQGVAMLPDQKTINVPLAAVTGHRDRDGSIPYPTLASTVAVQTAMESLRSAGNAFDLKYDDGSTNGVTYRVIMGSKVDLLAVRNKDNGIEFQVMATFQELPK